MMLQGIEQKDL